jgi:hypothetical protein
MKKIYAVRKGRQTGIFPTWEECQQSISGYPNNIYKSFPTLQAAEEWLEDADWGKRPKDSGIGPKDLREFLPQQRAERTALIRVLEQEKETYLHNYSVSTYCVIGFNDWIKKDFHSKKRKTADLLGCICIYNGEDECSWNCCRSEDELYPRKRPHIQLEFDPNQQNASLTQVAHGLVSQEEESIQREIQAVEAWSSGIVRIWFE